MMGYKNLDLWGAWAWAAATVVYLRRVWVAAYAQSDDGEEV